MAPFIPGQFLKGGCVENPSAGHFLLCPHPRPQAYSPHPRPFHYYLLACASSSPGLAWGDFFLQRLKIRTNSNTRAYPRNTADRTDFWSLHCNSPEPRSYGQSFRQSPANVPAQQSTPKETSFGNWVRMKTKKCWLENGNVGNEAGLK